MSNKDAKLDAMWRIVAAHELMFAAQTNLHAATGSTKFRVSAYQPNVARPPYVLECDYQALVDWIAPIHMTYADMAELFRNGKFETKDGLVIKIEIL